jgi:hypothetical protein
MKKVFYLIAFVALATSCKKEEVITKSHFIGEIYGGGIIIDVNKDSKGEEHGLIASTSDVALKSLWSATGPGGAIITNANSTTDGLSNCQLIKLTLGAAATACNACLDYSNDKFEDWYLPATSELFKIYFRQDMINSILDNDGNIATMPISPERYWSSTELDGGSSAAYTVNMLTGKIEYFSKSNDNLRIRAVRRF